MRHYGTGPTTYCCAGCLWVLLITQTCWYHIISLASPEASELEERANIPSSRGTTPPTTTIDGKRGHHDNVDCLLRADATRRRLVLLLILLPPYVSQLELTQEKKSLPRKRRREALEEKCDKGFTVNASCLTRLCQLRDTSIPCATGCSVWPR